MSIAKSQAQGARLLMDLINFKELKSQTVKNVARRAAVVGVSMSLLLATMLSLPANAADSNFKVRPVAKTPAGSKAYVPDQIIVMPKKGLEKDDLDQSIKDIDGKIVDKDMMGLAYLVEVPKGTLEKELAKASKDKNFTAVQRNCISHSNQFPAAGTQPNDPFYSQQFYLGQLGVQQAWALGATGQGVVYGALDTGVDYNYNPDLKGRTTGLLGGLGYQAYYNKINGAEEDLTFGHGSMTTACFGSSTNNGLLFASGCFNAQIIPVAITSGAANSSGEFSTTDFAVARGVEFLMINNCQLANLSFNGDPPYTFQDFFVHPLLQQLFAIYAARGGVCFNSAGNSGIPDGNGNVSPGLVVVAAVDPNLVPTSFTVWGPAIQFAAPGQNIAQSAYYGVPFIAAGTSFSSPLTASVAGQVKSARPNLSYAQVVQIMQATCSHPTNSQDTLQLFYGYGVPNAGAAVRLAQTSF